jgi:uncharacterized protein with HEPN domain
MSRRDARLLIDDIARAVQKIDRYVAGLDQEEFIADEKTVDAVVRNLEIVGEATQQLPPSFTAANPQIPWRQMAGLRNRIVHEYFGVDLEMIWQIITTDVPELEAQLTDVSFPE